MPVDAILHLLSIMLNSRVGLCLILFPDPAMPAADPAPKTFQALRKARVALARLSCPSLHLLAFEKATLLALVDNQFLPFCAELSSHSVMMRARLVQERVELGRHLLRELDRHLGDRQEGSGMAEALVHRLCRNAGPAGDGIDFAAQVDGDKVSPVATRQVVPPHSERLHKRSA